MRKLATIETITAIKPHPNADQLELAQVRGWQVVVKKGEFVSGDHCVYCEIDSVLPEREAFEFLRKSKFRIKTIRLRSEISQGIALPINEAFQGVPKSFYGPLRVGDDVTELLGVTLYQPPIPMELGGDIKGAFPAFIPKTDEERIQNCTFVLDKYRQLEWVATEKVDGCFERTAYLQLWNGGSTTMGQIVLKGERPTLIGSDANGNLVPCEITNTFRNGQKTNWIDVFFNPVHHSGHVGKSGKLRVTKNHKVFLHSGAEVSAGDIRIGDCLISCEETPDERILHYIKSSLLGDGSICSKDASNCKYSEGHKESHCDFCSYIEKIFGDCFASKRIMTSGYGSKIVTVTSKAYKVLNRLRREWYPENKKILPANIDWIDDFSIAKLYMDDGSLQHNELQNDRAMIATNGFNEYDARRIKDKIEQMYGVSACLRESRGYYSVAINYSKGTIDNFWNAIAKHIHPDFKYKLPEKYRDTVFTPYSPGKKILISAPVEVTDIQEVPVNKKNFPSGTIGFDLETTTHNYMCGGILVHNSSVTYFIKDGVFGACSRNRQLKDTPHNLYWQMARQLELSEKMVRYEKNFALQGELLGHKVQGNPYRLPYHQVRFFSLYWIDEQRYGDHHELTGICRILGLDRVPTIHYGDVLPATLEETLRTAEGRSDIGDTEREGLVYRPLIEHTDPVLGRLSFKAISNRFLLSRKD